jgi:2-methylcitrate dehydratase PrpD
MDAAFNIAKNIVSLRYEDIPPDVVDITKQQILDTLGVIAAASTMGEGSKEIVNLIKESGAKGKSTIIGYGGKVPSWMAGFANGAMVHELDFDDTTGGHPSSCTIPAAFAVAEEIGGISGKELIVAVALAVDLKFRMNAAILGFENMGPEKGGWMIPPLLGYYTSTAAAGRILGLSEDKLLDAFGHTLQQTSGSIQWQYSPGGVFRGIRDAFPNKAGILSALMAKRGLGGTRESLEGKAGFFPLHFGNSYDRSYLINDLGKKFYNVDAGFKVWPSCMASQSSINAALEILNEHYISTDNIEEIVVFVPETFEGGQAQIDTLEARRRPQSVIDAKFSIPFTLGIIATKRKMAIKDFTQTGLSDPDVLQMAQKVMMRLEQVTEDKKPRYPKVEIKTKNEERYSKRVDVIYGDPKNPITKYDLLEKFRDCVSYMAIPISKSKINKVIEMINTLEEVEDVSHIIRLLG